MTTTIKQLSLDQIEMAAKLVKAKIHWQTIADALGVSVYTLRANLDPSWHEREIRRSTVRSRGDRPAEQRVKYDGGLYHTVIASPRPPQSVLFERERAMHAPRSLTAAICGDPPAGRSALDKRQA